MLMGLNFKETDKYRFWSKVNKKGKNDCWYWEAGKDQSGYGRFNLGGRIFHSSQIALAISGTDVKSGDNVLHSLTCTKNAEKNFGDATISRLCCNPNHLRVGTKKENSADTKKCGRMRGLFDGTKRYYGENHPRVKLSYTDVLNILEDKRTEREIADEYKVAQSTINRIKNKKRRKLG